MNLPSTKAHDAMKGTVRQHREPVRAQTYRIGHDYPLQPDGATAIGRVRITDLREERAGLLSHKDAKAMGYRNTARAKVAWVEKHDKPWVLRMEAKRDAWNCLSELELLERFDSKHAHRLVLVIDFVVAHDIPRFMADQRRQAAGDGQYTSRATRSLDPSAECVDAETQARFCKQAEAAARSFRVDLEAGRQARKNMRRDRLFGQGRTA